jgi:hypothetical protein
MNFCQIKYGFFGKYLSRFFPNELFNQVVFLLIFIVHIIYLLKKNSALAKSGLLLLSIVLMAYFLLIKPD